MAPTLIEELNTIGSTSSVWPRKPDQLPIDLFSRSNAALAALQGCLIESSRVMSAKNIVRGVFSSIAGSIC
jgi:hypothetical protein